MTRILVFVHELTGILEIPNPRASILGKRRGGVRTSPPWLKWLRVKKLEPFERLKGDRDTLVEAIANPPRNLKESRKGTRPIFANVPKKAPLCV